MRTVTFQSVLWGTARLLGMDPTRDLTVQLATRLTAYINRAVAKAWRFEQWPEWTMTEQRWYRPFYAAGMFVTAGDEVYDPSSDKYYQALQNQAAASQPPSLPDSTGCYQENDPWWAQSQPRYDAPVWQPNTAYDINATNGLPYQVTNPGDRQAYQCIHPHTSGAVFDPTQWARLTPFTRVVDYEQDGQAKIWEAPNPCAFKRDPRVFTYNPWPLKTTRNDRGILFESSAPNTVWLRFWTAPPVFTTSSWTNRAYDLNELAYYQGDTFVSLQGNNTQPLGTAPAWGLVEFPFVLASYATRMAYSDALRDQKQTDRANVEQQNAEMELQDEADKALAAQGIYETATVETAPSPAIE